MVSDIVVGMFDLVFAAVCALALALSLALRRRRGRDRGLRANVRRLRR